MKPTFASMETNSGILVVSGISCPACGNTEWKNAGQAKDYSVTGEWFELRECTSCHLKATYPQPASAQLGRYYASKEYISHSDTRSGITNKLYHKAREFMMKKKHQWVIQALGKKEGRLLDIGAGTGHFAKFMQDHGWDVTALEPDDTARKIGAEKLELHILPLEELGRQEARSFDVITLWHVLEHVQDIKGYLEHFRSLLKPEGVLMIAVPNHTSRDATQYGSHWAAYDVPRHLWHFSPEAMKKLLARTGFSLSTKIAMPLDGFYVSMLSEKYKGNNITAPASAFLSGMRTFLSGKRNIDKASSIIYIAR